jgi:hypothetical protein
MIPAAFPRGRKLTRQATNVFFRRLSSRTGGGIASCSSQATKTNDAWSQKNERLGGDSWWPVSSALPAAFVLLGAGAIASSTEAGNDGHSRNNGNNLLSKLSSVLPIELSPTKAEENKEEEPEDDTTDVVNWSGTHQVNVSNKNYWEPESIQEVEKIIRNCQAKGQIVRPLGSSLSPNGVALNKDGMISMAGLDKILEIDTEKKLITVEAGVPVREVRNRNFPRKVRCSCIPSPSFETIR